MKHTLARLGWFGVVLTQLWAENLPSPSAFEQNLNSRLETHRHQLQQQSESIQKEKTALALQFLDLQQQCQKLQQEKNELDKFLKNNSTLDSDLKNQKRLLDTVRSNLKEGRRQIEQAMTPVQQMLFRQRIAEFDAHIDSCAMAELSRWTKELLQQQREFNIQAQNPQSLKGFTLKSDGQKIEGKLVDLGPVAFTTDPQNNDVVLLDPRHHGSLPHWSGLRQKQEPSKALLMPVDLFKGRALQAQQEAPTMGQQLLAGGLLVWPILALGVLGTLGLLWRFLALLKIKIVDDRRINPVIDRLWSCAEQHLDLQREALIERLYDELDNLTPSVERFLGTISVFASIAPLLGLLGTVTGMIKTFQSMGTSASQGFAISSGIAEALITTACGLMVAIPLMLGHALLQRKSKGILHFAESRIHTIADETLAPVDKAPSSSELKS